MGHTGEVNACVLSSDGNRLYSGSYDKSILVWDITTGQQLARLQSHTDGVTSLAWSGSLLVSGSLDTTVKLWDTGNRQLLHTLRGHSDHVFGVAVSSDGSQRIISAGGGDYYDHAAGDCKLRVWDAASGAQLAVLQGHTDAVRFISVSSDGRFAASAGQNGIICLWDLTSLTLCARLEPRIEYSVNSVLFV